MADDIKTTIIDDENDEYPPGFDEMIKHAVLLELATRLCENIDVTDEYRNQLVHDLADDFSYALREFREIHGYTEPIQYPHRNKILINRTFRFRGESFLPFPEVDTPYERFRYRIYRERKVKLRLIREERRPRKQKSAN